MCFLIVLKPCVDNLAEGDSTAPSGGQCLCVRVQLLTQVTVECGQLPGQGKPVCWGSASPKCFILGQSRQFPVCTLLWGSQHLAFGILALPLLLRGQVTSSPAISVSLLNCLLPETVPLGTIAAGLNETNVGKALNPC